jgi:hypothetical protein
MEPDGCNVVAAGEAPLAPSCDQPVNNLAILRFSECSFVMLVQSTAAWFSVLHKYSWQRDISEVPCRMSAAVLAEYTGCCVS